jgi:hypothetical protein
MAAFASLLSLMILRLDDENLGHDCKETYCPVLLDLPCMRNHVRLIVQPDTSSPLAFEIVDNCRSFSRMQPGQV